MVRILLVGLAPVTILAVAVAAYAWWHASKWAKLIAYGRIVVEYKGKVKMDAPLREWALWCEQTRKDKAQPERMRGHVIYVMGGTRIALFAGKAPPKVKPLEQQQRPGRQISGMKSREGSWQRSEKSSS